MKWIAHILIVLVMFLFACQQKENIVGTWVLDAIETTDGTINAEQLGDPSYTFNADHTYAIQVMGSTQAGTWKIEENKLILTLDNVPGQTIETNLLKNEEHFLQYSTGEGENQTTVSFIKKKETKP